MAGAPTRDDGGVQMTRTARSSPHAREGRLTKAAQVGLAADIILDIADDGTEFLDAYVTLCVHSGIASADVICMDRAGVYSRSERHEDAGALLERVDREAAKDLAALLAMKTRARYSDVPVRHRDVQRAGRAMMNLLASART